MRIQTSQSIALLEHVKELINASATRLQMVRWEADSVAAAAASDSNSLATPSTTAYMALRAIQEELAHLPASITGQMRWLALVMVRDTHECHKLLRGMLRALPVDFSVYHFDAAHERDASYRAFARQAWYSSPPVGASGQVVHRAFRGGSGCILESLQKTIAWMLTGSTGYTHLWKIDSDLDFRLFHYRAFRALVAHRAPLLSQPGILPYKKGRRATDRASLIARIAPTASGPATLEVSGRPRVLSKGTRVRDDVEIMCPLIDVALLPALYAAVAPMDTRNDFAASDAMNVIAREAARTAPGPWPPVNGDLIPQAQRPAGLVFDFVPLIHRDTRLVGWGRDALKLVNGTRCPRVYIPGRGRRFGEGWRALAAMNATQRGRGGLGGDVWKWTLTGTGLRLGRRLGQYGKGSQLALRMRARSP